MKTIVFMGMPLFRRFSCREPAARKPAKIFVHNAPPALYSHPATLAARLSLALQWESGRRNKSF
jgi:hypothetical protein